MIFTALAACEQLQPHADKSLRYDDSLRRQAL